MITIETNDNIQMKCAYCTHRHVCMYRKTVAELNRVEELPFIKTITECKYYFEETLDTIKIN